MLAEVRERAGTVPRRDVLAVAGFLALSVLAVVPYLSFGSGFYLDDWRNLARLDTVGWLRAAEASRFASRPGAWATETVLYTVLRDHPVAWVLALAVLGAATATALFVCLRRFTGWNVALAVVLVWLVLPNHTSLRVFANTAPMLVGLLLLAVGITVMDRDRLVLGALIASAGGLCYEVMLPAALAAVVLLHVLRHRGTRIRAVQGAAVVVVTGCLMLIHPTYNPANADRGSPMVVPAAHFGSGLTRVGPLAVALAVVAAVGVVVGLVRFARGERRGGSGPWLVAAGLGVVAVGVSAYVLKWPYGVRGQADRNYVVSSVGGAMVWVGCARVLLERWRPALVAGAVAFAAVMVTANVSYQRDWSDSAVGARRMLEAVDCRYRGRPPADLGVGPVVPVPADVRALHQFFLGDATRVTLGRPLRFDLTESDAEWRDRPPGRRVTWDELLDSGC